MSASVVFSTDVSTKLGLGVICLGISGICLVGSVQSIFEGSLGGAVLGVASATAFTFMWLYYATVTVVVTNDTVEVKRFWRPVWRAARKDVSARVGRGGEMKTHTALILESPGNRPIELVRTQFGKQALGQVASLLGVQEQIPDTIF
jgi:hypothetical protein